MKEIFVLFFTFLKIGTFTFGGGYAMVPAMRRDAVERYHWLEENEFVDIVATCQALPGAFATNFALFLGKRQKGWPGAVVCVLGTVLPAFIAIIVILLFLGQIENNPYVSGAFEGVMAASAALILATVWSLSRKTLSGKLTYLIAGVSFVIIVVLSISAIWAIVFGGAAGFVSYMISERKKRNGAEGSGEQ